MTQPSGETAEVPEGRRLPHTVLLVSDLHLGPGQDPETGRWHRRENFLADLAFHRFLEHYDPNGESALIILNGDIFDFVRISAIPRAPEEFAEWSRTLAELGEPRSPEELAGSIVRKERRFGLKTHDYKSVWKLVRIARGHCRFFEALGWWVARGGAIAFIKGNHDLELYWPLVQRAIRQEIARPRPGAAAEGRITFHQGSLRLANLYVEHGHRFASVTTVRGSPTMGDELKLPLGSFVNRYIINHLEHLDPALDNVKPVQDLLWTLARRHPLKVFAILWRALPFIRRSARPYWLRDSLGFALYFGSLALPVVTIAVIVLALVWPGFRQVVLSLPAYLRTPLGAFGIAAPFIVGFLRDLLPKRRPSVGEDQFAEGVHRALREALGPEHASSGPAVGVVYGVLGHTHAPDVQSLPPIDGAQVLYLNSGTWTPLWRTRRPDAGRTIYTFIRFDWTGERYAHQLLEWRDERDVLENIVIAPS